MSEKKSVYSPIRPGSFNFILTQALLVGAAYVVVHIIAYATGLLLWIFGGMFVLIQDLILMAVIFVFSVQWFKKSFAPPYDFFTLFYHLLMTGFASAIITTAYHVLFGLLVDPDFEFTALVEIRNQLPELARTFSLGEQDLNSLGAQMDEQIEYLRNHRTGVMEVMYSQLSYMMLTAAFSGGFVALFMKDKGRNPAEIDFLEK